VNERELARLILRYLLKHPNAADTIEGILDWWVRRELAQMHQAEILSVVEGLTKRGLLIERSHGDSRQMYFLNKDKLDEIALFLQQLDHD
jgi:hypothetical protein